MENRSRLIDMQMRRIVSKYELGELLGSGAYSQVFKAKHLEDGGVFAIKVISNRVLAENAKVKQCISNQLAIHNVLQPCLHIVRFYQLLQTRNNCYFVYQYCEGGTLHQTLKKEGCLDQKKAVDIFLQLVEGLKILRKHNIMHRDLKPQNVLIKEGNFKLADFGFCKELGTQNMTKTMLGSPLYMAPEVLRGQAYSVYADVWSVGVILYEMLYGHCPFQSNSIASLISVIDDTPIHFDSNIHVSANIKRFITKCLQKDCRIRLTWDSLFEQAQKLNGDDYLSSSHQIFPISFTKIGLKGNHSILTTEESEDKAFTPQRSATISKSKYQLFKQNYHRLQTQGVKNDSQILHHTNQNGKSQITERSRSITNKQPEIITKDKEKSKQTKMSYIQMISQHDVCLKILKATLQMLQNREKKNYYKLGLILKEVKRVLQKIYTRINLDDVEMLPVLSIVKYQLIQLQKVQTQIQKCLPGQQNDNLTGKDDLPIKLTELWGSLKHICPQVK